MENLWFNSWESILKIICITPLAYIAIVILLRASGKRTLSKMNAFDFVVTIALGSVLGSVSILEDVSLADGVTAFIIFIGFQYLFTWLSSRVDTFKKVITSQPSLIFYKGDFYYPAMRKERITTEEVYSIARKKGFSSLSDIDTIILETTGDLAIIKKITNHQKTTFVDVKMK